LEVADLGWTGEPPWQGFPCVDPFERCPARPAISTVQINERTTGMAAVVSHRSAVA